MTRSHRLVTAALICAAASVSINLIAQEPHAKPAIRGLVSMGAYKFVGAGGEPVNTLDPINAKPDNFGSYKLLVADVVDGRLRAVPRGVMAAAAVMDGSRGGVDLKKEDIDRVKAHLAKYSAKMDDTPPWDR